MKLNLFFGFSSAGLVERVVLLGTPIGIKDMNWEATRKVGRIFCDGRKF